MSGYVIKGFDHTKTGSTFKQAFPGPEVIVQEVGYTFGDGSQYRAQIIAETFEVAADMLTKLYQNRKGFYINEFQADKYKIADVSPYMRKELTKSFLSQEDPLSDENRLMR